MSQNTFTVDYINADGGGFSETIQVALGTTYKEFFAIRKPGQDPASYHIRVLRGGVKFTPNGGQLVEPGDVISVLSAKVEGAV